MPTRRVECGLIPLKLPPDARDIYIGNSDNLKTAPFHGKFGDFGFNRPVWSRDGEMLYVRRMKLVSRELDQYGMRGEVWGVSTQTGETSLMTPDADFSVTTVIEDNGTAWTGAKNEGVLLGVRLINDNTSGFVRLDPKTQKTSTLTRFSGLAASSLVLGYSPASNADVLAFVNESPGSPPEIHTLNTSSGEIKQATHVNKSLADVPQREVQTLTWTAVNGTKTGGLLILPPKQKGEPTSEKPPLVIVGDEVFACEIQTRPGTIEHIDWRIESVEDLTHKLVELPEKVSAKLKLMLSMMKLNFGAVDLIKDETGTYYFIEINPNGQYFWIELLTGAPLTEAMVSLILRLSKK
jgi:hypothetical protein